MIPRVLQVRGCRVYTLWQYIYIYIYIYVLFCLFICLYIYAYTYVYIYIYIHIHIYIERETYCYSCIASSYNIWHIRMCITYMYVCMYVCMCIYIYIYIDTHTYIHIYIYVCMYVYIYIYIPRGPHGTIKWYRSHFRFPFSVCLVLYSVVCTMDVGVFCCCWFYRHDVYMHMCFISCNSYAKSYWCQHDV